MKKDHCPADAGNDKTQLICYNRGEENGQLRTCSNECLGGCLDSSDGLKLDRTQDECFACKNYLSPMKIQQFSPNGNHVCWPQCSTGYVEVRYSIYFRNSFGGKSNGHNKIFLHIY